MLYLLCIAPYKSAYPSCIALKCLNTTTCLYKGVARGPTHHVQCY